MKSKSDYLDELSPIIERGKQAALLRRLLKQSFKQQSTPADLLKIQECLKAVFPEEEPLTK